MHIEGDEAARFGRLRNRGVHICTHVIDMRACVYMEPRRGEAVPKLPYRHANFLRRTQAWPPTMMTRIVVVVNANDGGGGGRDHYRTAFATHSAVSVLPVNGTRVVFSLVVESFK